MSKFITYCLVLFLIISLVFNYYLYKEKESFIIQIGTEHQVTVRSTLHALGGSSADFWSETLKEEDGNVRLERHIGKLHKFSQ